MQTNNNNNLNGREPLKKSQDNPQNKNADWFLDGTDEVETGIMGLIDKNPAKKAPITRKARIDNHE